MNRSSVDHRPPKDFFVYRRSDKWQARKRLYFECNPRTCSVCLSRPYSIFDAMKDSGLDRKPHLIHLTFDHLDGSEPDSDLAVLCGECYSEHLELSRETGEQLAWLVLQRMARSIRLRSRRGHHIAQAKAERARLRTSSDTLVTRGRSSTSETPSDQRVFDHIAEVEGFRH